mmetsp:Transcript_9850/g.25915  ORF Transcript_9850/g.25915 Transcript_9850/m.25915 type:complete len:168 (+) Transcript_9850:75-578(+)
MSDSGEDSDDGVPPPPKPAGKPRFKNDEELKAHEAELRDEALEDEATIKRLEAVRIRRENAQLEREAAEKTRAEEETRLKSQVAAEEEARQKALSERPTLEMPGPKDVKAALMKLQDCASDDFLKKHGLKGAGGNKLAKIKMVDFKKIFDDFQEDADIAELHKYNGT